MEPDKPRLFIIWACDTFAVSPYQQFMYFMATEQKVCIKSKFLMLSYLCLVDFAGDKLLELWSELIASLLPIKVQM